MWNPILDHPKSKQIIQGLLDEPDYTITADKFGLVRRDVAYFIKSPHFLRLLVKRVKKMKGKA